MKKNVFALILAASMALTAAACSSSSSSGGEGQEKTTITFADVGWDSIKLNNALAGLVAEEVFGYTWQETPGSTPILHEALLSGEIDVHMEEWTDNIAAYAADLEAGKFTELGVNFDDNFQGLYIPRYVADAYPELKTVRDLADYPELFPDPEDSSKGIIYGGITGWEITAETYELFRGAHTQAVQETCRALEETCCTKSDLKQAALLLAVEANAKRAAAERILCELGREPGKKPKGE